MYEDQEYVPPLAKLIRGREIGHYAFLHYDQNRLGYDLLCVKHFTSKWDCLFCTRISECIMLDDDERNDAWVESMRRKDEAARRRRLLNDLLNSDNEDDDNDAKTSSQNPREDASPRESPRESLRGSLELAGGQPAGAAESVRGGAAEPANTGEPILYDGSSSKAEERCVIPYIFDCQPYRVKTLNNLFRPAYNKLNRKREIAEILSETENQNKNNFPSTSTSSQQPLHKIKKIENNRDLNTPDETIFIDLTNLDNTVISHVQPTQTTSNITSIYSERAQLISELDLDSRNFNDVPIISQSVCKPLTSEIEIESGNTSVFVESAHISPRSTSMQIHSSTKPENKQKLLSFGKSPVSKNTTNLSQRSVGVQVYTKLVKPHIRSKSVMCKPCMTDASCQCQIQISKTCSPIKSLFKTPAATNYASSNSEVTI
ncbi:PREDICTED: uncharacterized protein LOC105460926 [Wasmannia auropunctata]|uniref:uncharacterized protein LOC105460926 n=1 Tax=Wasmannia auropunctata TaxID=64793 RepID=UPI0005EE22BF|nr:PREDICTED: uncharacterized protein LOC105460926 [Wasmannia auropunctata]